VPACDDGVLGDTGCTKATRHIPGRGKIRGIADDGWNQSRGFEKSLFGPLSLEESSGLYSRLLVKSRQAAEVCQCGAGSEDAAFTPSRTLPVPRRSGMTARMGDVLKRLVVQRRDLSLFAWASLSPMAGGGATWA
jgi:hypothetical protein